MNKFIAKYLVFLPGQALRGEHILKYIHDFEKKQWLSREEIERFQWKKLTNLLYHSAKYSPYYRDLFEKNNIDIGSIKDKSSFCKIPLLTKEHLRTKQLQLKSTSKKGRFSQKTTGGSTGQAVTLLKDRVAMAHQDAAMWRSLRWFGVDIGDKQARFWGVSISQFGKGKYRIIDYLMNRIRFSGFDFNQKTMSAFAKKVHHFKPTYFYGYVSLVKEFAEFCDKNKIVISVKAVVTTSEPLYEETREYIQKVFNCKVINDYGCGEVGPIAYDCPAGGFHLMADNLYIEIVTKDGRHAKEGEKGEIVVTELNNYSMPLLRYNLKDIAEITDEQCPCGRGLPLLRNITGRALDVLVATNGDRVHGEYFNYIAEEIKRENLGLKQYQVVQKDKSNLEIIIVRDKEFSKKITDYFTSKLKERMGDDMKITYKYTSEIEREPSGKLILVKNNMLQT